MEKLLEEVKFNCTEYTADKNELMSKIKELFAAQSEVYYLSESTDQALIGIFKDSYEITDRLMSLRVFCPVGEIYAIRDGAAFNVRMITEGETGDSVYVKDQRYFLRSSPSNLQDARNMAYREYYRTDEDGLLVLDCGRFLDLEIAGN